jgi:hypothetical protein
MNLITIGSSVEDCEDLPVSGTRARLILINYNDVERFYFSDIGVITSIVMKAGKVGYEFTGFRSDVKKSDEVIRREQSNRRFKHNVSFVVYEQTQLQKNNLKGLARGRFIGIIENNGKDDNSIEVLGKDVGVELLGGTIRDAHEAGGFFILNLSTPDNGVEFERKLPQTLGADYTSGLEIIEDVLSLGEGIFDETFDQTFN